MAIYEMTKDRICAIEETKFSEVDVSERGDLQRLLREQVEIISPDTLVIAEEFGEWEDSRRRLDLLGIDKEANLVVIELKRTEDGGHMELQAVRYAAMVSSMTFDKVTDIFGRHLQAQGRDDDPLTTILDFLKWDEPDEEEFAQDVRIVLASAEFSKELTTAVLWLNEHGLDIRCIRLKPYGDGERLLLDVQQIIPLPEAVGYIVQIKEKQKRERAGRKHSLDLTKYDVTINETTHERLAKRTAIFTIVKHLCDSGVTPDEVNAAVSWRRNTMFRRVDGNFDSDDFIIRASKEAQEEGRRFEARRYYCDDSELIKCGGDTYAFSNQWGSRTFEAISELIKAFPDKGIACEASP